MRVKFLSVTAEGLRDIVHELDKPDETVCMKLARKNENWVDHRTDDPVDCPVCIRRLAARAA